MNYFVVKNAFCRSAVRVFLHQMLPSLTHPQSGLQDHIAWSSSSTGCCSLSFAWHLIQSRALVVPGLGSFGTKLYSLKRPALAGDCATIVPSLPYGFRELVSRHAHSAYETKNKLSIFCFCALSQPKSGPDSAPKPRWLFPPFGPMLFGGLYQPISTRNPATSWLF